MMTKLSHGPAGQLDRRPYSPVTGGLHPAWVSFIRHCQNLGFGEISKLKIQDGVPVMAEETTKKVKFV